MPALFALLVPKLTQRLQAAVPAAVEAAVREVREARATDSAGGKKITKEERREIADAVGLALLRALAPKIADAVDAAVDTGPAAPSTPTIRSCNRHRDCDAADAQVAARGRHLWADHCHDDCCEDCFGQ